MSRKTTCVDNASMGNFFGILMQKMFYGERLKIKKMNTLITIITNE